jgi:hypothetical protein
LALQWFLTVLAVLVALLALAKARRVSKRLERLSESYWELRYEYGQINAKIGRADSGVPVAPPKPADPTTFVPLSSLKK